MSVVGRFTQFALTDFIGLFDFPKAVTFNEGFVAFSQ